MFQRGLQKIFLQSVATFPVVILTGARQTGKSTLCRTLLKKTHSLVSLEDPDIRLQALSDPRAFLERYKAPVILDEIQYAPDLPSYIQTIVDQKRNVLGQYILTGSQNFLMMQKVSQSLAGRAALHSLYPCSVSEVEGKKAKPRISQESVAERILKGGFPEVWASPQINLRTWCASYIRLYLERDVRNVVNVGDLQTFERFLQLVAIRTGCILNMSDIARDAGISLSTAKRWFSVLQSSYQIYFLPPFYKNLSKRLVKSPKIYFGDTALACYLMGIFDIPALLTSHHLGNLFETMVVLEHLKVGSFAGDDPRFSYFRTKQGLEVDIVIEEGGKVISREIKFSKTIKAHLTDPLLQMERLLATPVEKQILAPVAEPFPLTQKVHVLPWANVEWK